MGKKSAVETLIEKIRHEVEPPRRYELMGELAMMGQKVIPRLKELLYHDPEIASHAAEMLSWIGEEGADILTEALQSEHEQVRKAVASVMSEIHTHGRNFNPLMLKGLRDSSMLTRLNSINWCKSAMLREAIPDLIELLQDEEAEVRERAAEVLGEPFNAREATPHLLLLLDDPNKHVAFAAARALGAVPDVAFVPRLIEVFNNTSDKYVQNELLSTIAMPNSPQSLDFILKVLQGGDIYFTYQALRCCGWCLDAKAIPYVKPYLKSDNAHHRWGAVDALYNLAHAGIIDRSVADDLRPCLEDEPYISRPAKWLLGVLED